MPNTNKVQQRAINLGRRIQKAIKDGVFRLDVGYASKPHPIFDPAPKGVVCQGCALAAAAFVISREPLDMGQEGCLEVVTEAISRDDAAQLECGYERWTHTTHAVRRNGKVKSRRIKAKPNNAFYKLGAKLRTQRLGA